MIRLGSLAGYAFSGPRLLGSWTPPAGPGVWAVLYKPEPERERYAVIYVAHSADLAGEGLPFRHPRAHCWTRRAGSKWRLYVATLEIPGGGPGHRRAVVDELIAVYRPRCNAERVEPTWRDEWIGAPPTRPE